jgi:tRNA pseudouridine55 synthase
MPRPPTRQPPARSQLLTPPTDRPPAPCGILLLDKPQGLSSNAALQRVRWLFGKPKAGHTGSLDPLATGMLPLCIGEATKLAGALLAEGKAYEFELTLGARTDTGDAEGQVVEELPVPPLDGARIAAVLAAATGPQQQVPPMYSALKQAGQPLYKLARRGLSVERAPRAIVVESLQLLGREGPRLRLRAHCSKGTYVRVLGEDIARALGTCGHLTALRRLHVEPFSGDAMVTLEQLEASTDRAALLLPADRAVQHLPAARLDAAGTASLLHGQPVRPASLAGAGAIALGSTLRLYGAEGAFLGLGEAEAGGLVQPRRLLRADLPGEGGATFRGES